MDFFLSPDHLAALAVTALLCVALPVAARMRPGRWTRLFARLLGVALLGWFVAYHVVVIVSSEPYSLRGDLPLHLTDAATLVAAVALLCPRPLAFELAYFWGLAASLQALITPNLGAGTGFSSFLYWHFFVTHGGVVVAAIFLAFGVGMSARTGAVRRVFLATLAWTGVAAAGSLATGGNYMYLREPPATGSLLDYMGPWPLYLVTAALLALVLFTLLDLPFRRRRTARPPRS